MPATLARTDELGLQSRLTDLVRDLAADRASWEPLIDLGGSERTWAKLPTPADLDADIWVISWHPSNDTELHSHGTATAAFTVVRGSVTEIRPDESGRLQSQAFSAGDVQIVHPGEIHDVRNEGTASAVTIHAYSPALDEMRFYRHSDNSLVLDRVVLSTSAEAEQW